MGKVIGGMTVSLDGFVNDRNGDIGRLYPDMDALLQTEILQELMQSAGAAVMGRRTYAMGDPDEYADGYEFQVPIFVLTHQPPARHPKGNERLTFTFVTDGVESAIAQAKAAAGAKDVVIVGGASTFQQCLKAASWTKYRSASSQSCWAMASACSMTAPPRPGNWSKRGAS
jgi:dihydrofolate reductase